VANIGINNKKSKHEILNAFSQNNIFQSKRNKDRTKTIKPIAFKFCTIVEQCFSFYWTDYNYININDIFFIAKARTI